jgi:thioredoxin 1
MIKQLENQEEYEKIVSEGDIVLADFFAEWCGQCNLLSPVLDQLSKEMGESLKIVKIDVDKFPEVAEKANVHGYPSLFFFKGGKLQEIAKGFRTKEQLIDIVKQYV